MFERMGRNAKKKRRWKLYIVDRLTRREDRKLSRTSLKITVCSTCVEQIRLGNSIGKWWCNKWESLYITLNDSVKENSTWLKGKPRWYSVIHRLWKDESYEFTLWGSNT